MKRAILVVFAFSAVTCSGQQCATLQNASPTQLLSYLNGLRDTRQNTACIASAIKSIGDQRFEPAILVLTKFLDFSWPIGVHQKQRLFVLEHDGASIHPAATALEQIGKNALPAVMNAMKSTIISRESMEVAVSVWMTIYKDRAPTGVALLQQEADMATQPVTRQRLGWAAFLAARGWCSPSDQPQCKAAARIQ